MKTIQYLISRVWIIPLIPFLSACDPYFDVAVDRAQVVASTVFNDDGNATAAVNGIYQTMVASSFAGGGESGVTLLSGLSSDELHNILQTESYAQYESNEIQSDDRSVTTLWNDAYRIIYQANDILEGLRTSTHVTTNVRDQLTGEVLLTRAYCYFYLVNLFGEVPIVLTTDYHINSGVPRATVLDVYDQIVDDLNNATQLLSKKYVASTRTRPNRYAAFALLARVHLFRGQWEKAESVADSVITNSQTSLEQNLENVFKIASTETIWQLASEAGYNTKDGAALKIEYSIGSSTVGLTDSLLASFSLDDKRKDNWVAEYNVPETGEKIWYAAKYKASFVSPTSEYYVLLRLAEQYLIRAEARAKKGDLPNAISDIDHLRKRAGLEAIQNSDPGISQDSLLLKIYDEWRAEYFVEQGLRWFTLKRLETATDVLQPIKGTWQETDVLYPIPAGEFQRNPALGLQNDGY